MKSTNMINLYSINTVKPYSVPLNSNKKCSKLDLSQIHTNELNVQRFPRLNLIYFTSNVSGVDKDKINWNEQTVLVTGGTGTVGKSFVETIFNKYHPKKIIVLSRNDLKQKEMKNSKLDDSSLEYISADIKNLNQLKKAFKNVDIVIHTAAMKNIPECEERPEETVETNIIGTKNVIDAAIEGGVKRVLYISSDKASYPTTTYGATKLISEKLLAHANSNPDVQTLFSCIRLGNVLGSSGSVIPVFKKQRENGEITITDERMTRFWITPKQVTNYIISCVENMQGGEIFIPKFKTMNLKELVQVVAPDCKIKIIGSRPGEKLHEQIITDDETKRTLEFENYYAILPAYVKDKEKKWPEGEPVPEDFKYTSDSGEKLCEEDLKDCI